MFSRIKSATIIGLDAYPIDVEVDVIDAQLPGLSIVGLADKSVQEAKERIFSAIKNTGINWPRKKLIVNLAPADIPKFGTNFDLPIAIGILAFVCRFDLKSLEKSIFVGELALDGSLRKVPGVLPIAIMAKDNRLDSLYVPLSNANEAAVVSDLNVYGVKTLKEIVDHLSRNSKLDKFVYKESNIQTNDVAEYDFADIKGQNVLKRAALISAAGGHNVLLSGTPGSGKTMIARAISTILPDMTFEESLEVTRIYSVANLLEENTLIKKRPFRSPHHTSSTVSIVGGGKQPKPGEVSLAHRGILFLDEFPEFPRYTLESLRQPLEDKKITIARASGTIVFPSNFTLIAAMNPCPCGWLGDDKRKCTCTQSMVEKYRRKISGPILDRIDLQIKVNRVELKDILSSNPSSFENSIVLREKVNKCRQIQLERYKNYNIYCNAEVPQKLVEKLFNIDVIAFEYLVDASSKLFLSARSIYRILRVARTIADLEFSEVIKKIHVNEALFYRINN